MKKFVALLLVLMMAVPTFAANLSAENVDLVYRDIKITFDEKTVVPLDASGNSVQPFIYNGRTYLPLRAIGTLLGKDVLWDNETRSAIIGDVPAEAVTLGEEINIFIDGKRLTPENELLNIEGSLFLPVREISEAFSLIVDWDDVNSTVVITSSSLADAFCEVSLHGTSLCLNIKELSADKAARLCVSERASVKEESWRFKKCGADTYCLINEKTLLAADVNSASKEAGAEIIQWTPNGGSNQQWLMQKNEDGSVALVSKLSGLYLTEQDGAITQEEKSEDKNQAWDVKKIGEYKSIIKEALKSDAYKELNSSVRSRFDAYVLGDAPYSITVYDKAETLLNEKDFSNVSKEEQTELLRQCMEIPATNLLSGSMAIKLTADIKINSVEKKEHQSIWGEQDIDAWYYDISIDDGSLKVVLGGAEDEEYALRIAQSVACFEKPIRKMLHTFYYSDTESGTWNGGGGQIWNNTKYKGDVNNMVQMFAHELGHVLDNGSIGSNSIWTRAQSADMVPVSGYGNTNRWEDLAEFSRLFLLARGDEEREKQIESVYPNRLKMYKALLYHTDKEFYSQYESFYNEAVKPIGEPNVLNAAYYYLIKNAEGTLTVENGALGFGKDAFEWQFIADDIGYNIVSKNGDALYVASKRIETGFTIDSEEHKKSTFVLKETDGMYEITNEATGFVMGKFELEKKDKIEGIGYFKIADAESGKCLAISEDRAGARVVLADAADSDTQIWFVTKFEDNKAYIINKASGKCIDVSGNNTEKDGVIIVWNSTKADNQTWKIEKGIDDLYSITALHSNLTLGINDGEVLQGYETRWVLSEVE